MHAKFASLTVLISVLLTSQAVGAVPKAIDCSKVSVLPHTVPSARLRKFCRALAARLASSAAVFVHSLSDSALRVPCLGRCPGNVAPQAASQCQRT
ncbi:hypothetical protein B0H13DRAFT_2074333, partial [Mycena leptocephala]